MRIRAEALLALVATAAAVAAVLVTRDHASPTPVVAPPVAQPPVSVAGRVIVVLRAPSVATRVAQAGSASAANERAWTAQAFAEQGEVLARLAANGLGTRPDYTYARVLNGFAARLDPRAVAALDRDPAVEGIYQVRATSPATASARVALAGFDGRGVRVTPVVERRSDQLIAALERTVDPNGDGDTHDASRIAVLAVTEPDAGFADAPEARAVAGARALGTLAVDPATGRAAAVLAQARPTLGAGALQGLLASYERSGAVDLGASLAGELATETSLGTLTLLNVSTRPLRLTITPLAGVASRARLGIGRTLTVHLPSPTLSTGLVEIAVEGGATLSIPWAPPQTSTTPGLVGASLTPAGFRPSDDNPAVLTVETANVAMLRLLLCNSRGRVIGELTRVRDLLPGPHRFAITGRDAAGAVLATGRYELQLTTAGPARRLRVPFRIE